MLIHSVTYNADGAPASAPPVFSDIHFKNTNIISRDGYNKKWLTTGITIDGFDNDNNTDENYIQNVTFEDITLGTSENIDQTISLKRSKNISFYNVLQYDGNEPTYSKNSASNITVDAADNNDPSAPTGLLTNELENPLNAENSTFGWIVNDKDKDEVQTAYEIVITDEVTGEKVWDSGKVESSEQSYVGMTEGTPIDDNPDDGDVMPITFGYTMQNNKLTDVDAYRNERVGAATVYIATYDSFGRLDRLITKPLEAGEGNTEQNYTLSDDEAVERTEGGIIKLFVWEQGSEGTMMKPLSEAEKIDGTSGSAHSSSDFANVDSLEAAHPYSWRVR
ncbi:MAG: hypothetical protein IJR33_08785, partial [Clostridia bacterium]|nr:hypothetical protein [Clostridia bacterium]